MRIPSKRPFLSKVNPFTFYRRKIQAFILNLDQHWFTLRRFGDASPLIEADEGNGLWFNLNSSLPAPEWLSKTYLGMVISQAEAEGKLHTDQLSL
jgi:ataxin-3